MQNALVGPEFAPEAMFHVHTNEKGVKNNTNFGQITGIQEKLATTCK
jgi:hypothetical protein